MFHYQEKLKDLKVELKDNIYTIKYKDELVEVLFGKDGKFKSYYIEDAKYSYPKENLLGAHHIVVGTKNLRRDVWHLSRKLPTLRCGLTIHDKANTWSSTPHPFEKEPVAGFEEVFLYLLSGGKYLGDSTAIQVGQGVWEDYSLALGVWRVQDRDISAIPMGYHPVVGEPGVHVSYIWAYLAKRKEWEKI